MEPIEPDERPAETEAVDAAEQMNDPQGPQPGVVDDASEPDTDGPLPELMP